MSTEYLEIHRLRESSEVFTTPPQICNLIRLKIRCRASETDVCTSFTHTTFRERGRMSIRIKNKSVKKVLIEKKQDRKGVVLSL